VTVATGAANTETEFAAEVETAPGGLVTVQEIVSVPDAAVSAGEMVIEFVPAPAVIVPVAPVPPTVQANVPDWAGTLAVKLVPAVALAIVDTVEFGRG
jgi:hypothetical protein